MANNVAGAGQYHDLPVIKQLDFGLVLDGNVEGGEMGNLLLPKRYVPAEANIGDVLKVFVYHDSEDRLIATTETPKITISQCAYLKVVDVNYHGAFVDWGLPKDLMVPYNEQATPMQKDKYYVVCAYADKYSKRMVASSKLNKHVQYGGHHYQENDTVEVLVADKTDLGYKVVVNHHHWGIVYHNEVLRPLGIGQLLPGRIAKVRADGKLDIRLENAPDFESLEQKILQSLDKHQGFIAIHDKTDPKVIAKVFGVSKKRYKQALGALKSQGKIKIEAQGVTRI